MIIRDALPDEREAVGKLRVAAYRALGLLPDGSRYAETLRGFGFGSACVVLVAAGENESGLLGTITLSPFGGPGAELARDRTEADIRAFAVAAQAQGRGVGKRLLLTAMERAGKLGVTPAPAVHAVGDGGGAAPLRDHGVLQDTGARLRAGPRRHPARV